MVGDVEVDDADQPDPEQPVAIVEPRPRMGLLEGGELLPEGEVLQGEVSPDAE